MKKLIIALCITMLPMSSFAALTAVDDGNLNEVTGQAGVSIGFTPISLDLTIDTIAWTDTDANGGTVALNGVDATGVKISPTLVDFSGGAGTDMRLVPLTIDVIDELTVVSELDAAMAAAGMSVAGNIIAGHAGGIITVDGYNTGNGIVKIGVPSLVVGIDHIGVDSITVASNAGVYDYTTDDVSTAGGYDSFGQLDINGVALTTNGGGLYIFAH